MQLSTESFPRKREPLLAAGEVETEPEPGDARPCIPEFSRDSANGGSHVRGNDPVDNLRIG